MGTDPIIAQEIDCNKATNSFLELFFLKKGGVLTKTIGLKHIQLSNFSQTFWIVDSVGWEELNREISKMAL